MPLDQPVALYDVTSSNLGRIGYESTSKTLYVQFRDQSKDTLDGHLYEYYAVPPTVYVALLLADNSPTGSVGSTFHQLVKRAGYRYNRRAM